MDESLLVDHDDSNICHVPSEHNEDNGKFKNLYFHWLGLCPLWKQQWLNLTSKLSLN